MMLYKLLSATDRGRFKPVVIALTAGGPMADTLRALGVPVHCLGLRPSWPNPLAVARLLACLRRENTAFVQTWMYHADLLGGLAGRWLGLPVLWGVRQSTFDPASKRSTRAMMKLCARLSRRVPARIVCCAQAAAAVHRAEGYAAEKMLVIPNGFDVDEFKPAPQQRDAVRTELGLAPDTPLVGLVARFDPQKDHRTFLEAAALLHRCRPEVNFLLCGAGVEPSNPDLAAWCREGGLNGVCHLLGPRSDMARFNAALDVAVSSSSYGEGFPNVLGEAMAAGVPCVVTDVGDSAAIVGDTGRVVAPRDPAALAAALAEVLALPAATRQALGAAARQRVVEQYSLPVVARRFEALYQDVLR